MSIQNVAAVVRQHYREELWQAIKANIAVVASLSLQGRDNCLVLVHEGPSGQGKSVVVRAVMPNQAAQGHFLRVDDFTPAAFVSHAANRRRQQLEQHDLLPRLRDKVMLTKELAPLFRNDDRVLRQNFARLTSILDGNGYMSVSGSHGSRGYQGRYLFNWIGATTPIPDRTHRIMAQLGNRILFYEIQGEEVPEDDLVEFARSYGGSDNVTVCQQAVSGFLEEHFQRFPVNSVDRQSIAMPDDLLRMIVKYATLIAHGRIEIDQGDFGVLEAGEPEGPHRIILLLQTLIYGLALVYERNHVVPDDVLMVRHIAYSCIPKRRREMLRALLSAQGQINSRASEGSLGISRPTALDRMKELAATRIAVYRPGDQQSSVAASLELAPEWGWLLEITAATDSTGEPHDGTTAYPLSDPGVCG